MPAASRYILHKKIARGGMAEIYLGKQVGEDGFQRVCCIKRILPHYAQEHDFIEMFRDEAHICKRLQHANIVRVEGFEEVEGSYAIIMEFINGGDLRSVLSACEKQQTRLSVPMALYIIAEAARGLHYAHTKNDDLTGKPLDIVHRDISPQNILISFEGEVKVTDFGIADADNKATETKPGVVKGKYSYMSPEQISAAAVDARTDVFALTIVLWEMLAMQRLFQGENEVATIQLVKNCQIDRDLRQLNPELDDELYELIKRGLGKQPAERFASANELENSLRRYINKRYADFTISDLAKFLKKAMHSRLLEMQEQIKDLLSHGTNPFVSLQPEPSTVILSATPAQDIPPTSNAGPVQAIASKTMQPNPFQEGPISPSLTIASAQKRLSTANYTGVNRLPSASQTGVYTPPLASSRRPMPQRRQSSSLTSVFILSFLLLLSVSAIGFVVYKKYFYTQALANISFSVTPASVRVSVNGKPLFRDNYISSPFELVANKEYNTYSLSSPLYGMEKIAVSLDKPNSIVFQRTGFKDEVFTFLGQQPLEKFIVLEKQVDMAPIRIRLKTAEKAMWLKIDAGEVTGIIQPGKEFDAKDITFGDEHMLHVFPDGLASKNGYFHCSFIPRAQNWSAPYLIELHPEKATCSFPPR